ncbi:sensor histidine kinase [Clostridium sp. C8-1-8]|uniref:sensor histidine kinase n=1 Tax=Clostridium sp. C8-1-8 TaxID=2698831 RepID=UPI001369D0EE|nr:sensor histidine kinase [Clostridium sp. C8-1-8]
MKFKNFLKDRVLYIVVYFISNTTVILIMYLTLIINKINITKSNVFYAFFVSTILFLLFIVCDYYRNRSFLKQLEVILKSEDTLNQSLSLGDGLSKEQEMFKKILIKIHKHVGEKTIKYEETHKQYMHFVNQWVHQMKTPVSVINLMLQDQTDSDHREVFDSILEENEKISHGLDMMLNNARLSEFNLDFKVESLDIISIVRKAINDNKKSMIRNHIFPKINVSENISVQTDKKWIYFVINQIVINAIKYCKFDDDKSKSIFFSVSEEEATTTLSITDEGIGIPKEDLSRIFNAFFTGKNGRKTSESTGMGMYLSKRVCDELGHELKVISEEGKGTTFFIVFYNSKNLFKF